MSAPTALRGEGTARAVDHADMRVIAAIDAVIERHIARGQSFSANDIRADLPTVTSPGLVGARVLSYAARRPRVMRRVGYEPSTLPSTHGHPVAIWRGVAS